MSSCITLYHPSLISAIKESIPSMTDKYHLEVAFLIFVVIALYLFVSVATDLA